MASAKGFAFQNDMAAQLVTRRRLLSKPKNYNRELALYLEDLRSFVQETQDELWQKFGTLYPNDPKNLKHKQAPTQAQLMLSHKLYTL